MKKTKDVNELKRDIPRKIEAELWGRAGGRCEFNDCNRILYRSPVTCEPINLAEKAHIYSFSKDGPRGWGVFATQKDKLNSISNLMLLCQDCHVLIDSDLDGSVYSADKLREWKKLHEARVETVTGICPSKKTLVVLYGANIGKQGSKLQPDDTMQAVFPKWNPFSEHPIELSMQWAGEDCTTQYWESELQNLMKNFSRSIEPLLLERKISHISIFGLAPIPLLVVLGALFTDKCACRVYQLHREPTPSWEWVDQDESIGFKLIEPTDKSGCPVLALSLSDSIDHNRITKSISLKISLWELTVDSPNNDLIKSEHHLSQFREKLKECIVKIGQSHGKDKPILILPAIPVSCAIELGRIRMPKADGPWVLYDFNSTSGRFSPVIKIHNVFSVITVGA